MNLQDELDALQVHLEHTEGDARLRGEVLFLHFRNVYHLLGILEARIEEMQHRLLPEPAAEDE